MLQHEARKPYVKKLGEAVEIFLLFLWLALLLTTGRLAEAAAETSPVETTSTLLVHLCWYNIM